jgi:plastocyanin
MKVVRPLLAAGVAAAALAVPATAATPALRGSVGPGFTITMSPKSAKAGKVKITVSDRSGAHNFHLTGPGVNKKTSVGGSGTTTWTVTLRKGTYRFVCDPHASGMRGSFKVS